MDSTRTYNIEDDKYLLQTEAARLSETQREALASAHGKGYTPYYVHHKTRGKLHELGLTDSRFEGANLTNHGTALAYWCYVAVNGKTPEQAKAQARHEARVRTIKAAAAKAARRRKVDALLPKLAGAGLTAGVFVEGTKPIEDCLQSDEYHGMMHDDSEYLTLSLDQLTALVNHLSK